MNKDTIYRQEAIDALENMSANYGAIGRREWHPHVNECMNEIRYLPSAQPEPHWIPCSERLPEEADYKPFSYYDGVVLYCTRHGEIGFGWYYDSTKKWANEDDTFKDVIAWMPLPEPYAERRTDEQN